MEKTEAQKRAQRKYMASVATIQIRTTPERRDEINAYAAAQGISANTFINRAIEQAMKQGKDPE